MKRKLLLQLEVQDIVLPKIPFEEEIVNEKTWCNGTYTITYKNYIYNAQVDNSTGENVLIIDMYADNKHVWRMFTTHKRWFRRWSEDGFISEAGLDYSVTSCSKHYADEYYCKFTPCNDDVDKTIKDYFEIRYASDALNVVENAHRKAKEKKVEDKYTKIREATSIAMLEIRPLIQDVYTWIKNGLMKDSRYLFYQYKKGGGKTTAICSHCMKQVEIAGQKIDKELICPSCHSKCICKSAKKMQNSSGFIDKSCFSYLQPTKAGYCLRQFELSWTFIHNTFNHKQDLYETARIFYKYNETKNKFEMVDNYGYDNFYNTGSYEWVRWRADDFIRSNVFPGNINKLFKNRSGFTAYHVDFNKIARTCGKIIPKYLYEAGQTIKVLQNCVDSKLFSIAKDLIDMTRRNDNEKQSLVNNDYGSLRKALRITKDDLPFLQSVNPNFNELRFYNWCKDNKKFIGKEDFITICKKACNRFNEIKKLTRYCSFKAIVKYLECQEICYKKASQWKYANHFTNAMDDWIDYISFCNLLEYDIKDRSVLMPANLKYAHDETYKIINSLDEGESQLPQIERMAQSLNEQYYFETNKLLIRAPKDHNEIKNEGTTLHHCVATYAKRVALCETIILFIRKKTEPDKSYFTLNLDPHDGRIIQCRGFKNCHYPAEVEKFMNKWHQLKVEHNKTSVA